MNTYIAFEQHILLEVQSLLILVPKMLNHRRKNIFLYQCVKRFLW